MPAPEPDASADDPLDSTGSVELEIVNGNGALMRTTWVVSGRVTTLVVYRGSASSRRLRSSAASVGAVTGLADRTVMVRFAWTPLETVKLVPLMAPTPAAAMLLVVGPPYKTRGLGRPGVGAPRGGDDAARQWRVDDVDDDHRRRAPQIPVIYDEVEAVEAEHVPEERGLVRRGAARH